MKGRQVLRRDPVATRRRIIEAAKVKIAREGTESLNVAEIAREAGLNRGTAYNHFRSRDALLRATILDVAAELSTALFPPPGEEATYYADFSRFEPLLEGFAYFLMSNVALVRPWIADLLVQDGFREDPLWMRWHQLAMGFVRSGRIQKGVDGEVLSISVIGAVFVWTLWVRPEKRRAAERRRLARRFAREIIRMSQHGIYARAAEPDARGAAPSTPEGRPPGPQPRVK